MQLHAYLWPWRWNSDSLCEVHTFLLSDTQTYADSGKGKLFIFQQSEPLLVVVMGWSSERATLEQIPVLLRGHMSQCIHQAPAPTALWKQQAATGAAALALEK